MLKREGHCKECLQDLFVISRYAHHHNILSEHRPLQSITKLDCSLSEPQDVGEVYTRANLEGGSVRRGPDGPDWTWSGWRARTLGGPGLGVAHLSVDPALCVHY
ncbi:hypothetical protein E2C01_020440 [Portunus trituberculatus]|uniref:Uncharacterized protein n=1 Tax=Portunus trituberculatus TaxID=210409 RepID=A0A5B7DZS0_PORTR|nr:hypothetical protein [Portunus trituberculatus]